MKNANNIHEKISYTTGEKLTEILCEVLMAATLAVYIFIDPVWFNAADIAAAMISAVVYGVLTGLSVRPDLISKPENLHRNRRIFIAVKMVIIALWLAVLAMTIFHFIQVGYVACT